MRRSTSSQDDLSSRAGLKRQSIVALVGDHVALDPCGCEEVAVDFFNVDHKLAARADQVSAFFNTRFILPLEVSAVVEAENNLLLCLAIVPAISVLQSNQLEVSGNPLA